MKYNDEKINRIDAKINFDDLKNVYFLTKIFEHINKRKYLDIVKYNKKLQNRLNLSINDYKDYYQLYAPIEIELKLVNYENIYNNRFINISDENMNYYHIFFDNSSEEIKRTELNDTDKANKIKIIIDYHIKSFKNLFYNCNCIKAIHFKNFQELI